VSGFRQTHEETVFDGRIIRVAVGEFETPSGAVISRDIVRHPGAVSVVPIVDDHVVLVRQYRAALGQELLEIPAGLRDVPDEPPERTAERELIEEVGLRPRHLDLVARFYNSAGFCDEYSYVFVATDFDAADAEAHGVEEQYMTIERVALDEVPAMIADGRLCDAKTIIGLTLALRRLGR
jgi:8-oxo-dGTP pyrophosphatase MutT (NUDIX family)